MKNIEDKALEEANFQCKDCPDRYPGCHDVCESYSESKQKYRRANKEAKESKKRSKHHYSRYI